MQPHGTLFIIAAPSGAGKTSLVRHLTNSFDSLLVSVSHTTRPQRPGETDGIDYFFISEDQFKDMVDQHTFLEYATVYGYHYGTSQKWVEEKLKNSIDIILEIDWQGAQQIRNKLPDSVSIFILPPSREVLINRLVSRGQDEKHVIEKRMAQLRSEIQHCREFDYLIINDDFSKASEELSAIFLSQQLQREKQELHYKHIIDQLV